MACCRLARLYAHTAAHPSYQFKMSNLINIKFKLFIIYLLYIDSMLGLIITNNELTYLLTLLNAIIIPIVILTTNSIILIEYIFLLGIIIMISFSTLNILI